MSGRVSEKENDGLGGVGVWCAGANETEKDVLMSASEKGDVMGEVWVVEWGRRMVEWVRRRMRRVVV